MIHGTLSLQELSLFALHVEFWVRHYGQVVLSFRPINHLSSHSFQNNASVSTFQMPKWELYPSSLVANLAIPASYVLLSNIYDMHPRGHDTVDILLLLMKKKRRRKSIVIIGCLFAHVHCMCCVVCVRERGREGQSCFFNELNQNRVISGKNLQYQNWKCLGEIAIVNFQHREVRVAF